MLLFIVGNYCPKLRIESTVIYIALLQKQDYTKIRVKCLCIFKIMLITTLLQLNQLFIIDLIKMELLLHSLFLKCSMFTKISKHSTF